MKAKNAESQQVVAYKNNQIIYLGDAQVKSWDELSPNQLKIAMYSASKVKPEDTSETQYTMTFKEFASLCKYESTTAGGSDYEKIYREARKLARSGVDFVDSQGDIVIFNWLTSVRISPKSGTVKYKLDEALLPFYKTQKGSFAIINLLDYMPLRGKYALLLFEFLAKWQNQGKVYQTIDDLRSQLHVPDGKYKRPYDLMTQVIYRAVEEINEKVENSFLVKVEEKRGKRATVDGVTFYITSLKHQPKRNTAVDYLVFVGVDKAIAAQLAKDYTERRIIGNVDFAKSKSGVKNLPAYIVSAIQEDYAEVEQISLVTQQRQEQETAAKVKAEELAAAQAKALEEEDAARMAPVSHDSPFAKKLKLKKKVTQETPKEEEPAEIKPTIATAAEIVEIERLNHGMTRGKWNCIAGILNKKLRYNEQLEPWTAETIKKAFLKARKAQA